MASLDDERIQYEAALKALLESLNSDGGGIGGGTITNPTLVSAINYVKAKLDELVPTGKGVTYNLSASPNISNPLDLLIAAHMTEGVKDVILSAPLSVLFPTALAGKGVHTEGEKTGYIVLPATFLRLSSLRMADWERDGVLTVPETPLGKKQSNKWLRGGTVKPVGVLDWKNIAATTGGLKTLTIAAGGTGFAPGANTLTVVQTGGSLGTINVTASAEGIITGINSITTAGTGYAVANALTTTGGTGANCTVNLTAIEATYSLKRVINYYSVDTSHVIDKLFYIPEQTAETFLTVNPNLLDALAWTVAGKIMQITGMVNEAKMAQERVQQSYINL